MHVGYVEGTVRKFILLDKETDITVLWDAVG